MLLSQSIGQFNTDTHIASYFQDGEKLYGLDIGAVDGIFINNTYLLEKEKGAEILCVEANPYYYNALKSNRKHAISCAVGAENKDDVDFFVVKVENNNNLSSVSSLRIDENLLNSHKNNYNISQWTEKVNVRTLDYILEEWNPPRLDLVSIDVEGLELDILTHWQTLDFYKPRLLVLEANDTNHENKIINFMKSKGYILSKKIEVNLFFIKP